MTYSQRETIEGLKEQHPNWLESNVVDLHGLYLRPNTEDGLKYETLLEAPCVHCGQEMGTHRFSMGSWRCPIDTV